MDNRIEAYIKIYPRLKDIRLKVFRVCEGRTIPEISNILGIPEKTISGRLSELEEMGIIHKYATKDGKSVFKISPENMIDVFRDQYHYSRAQAMINTLRDKYSDYIDINSLNNLKLKPIQKKLDI